MNEVAEKAQNPFAVATLDIFSMVRIQVKNLKEHMIVLMRTSVQWIFQQGELFLTQLSI
jgi:hypothetical protein